MWLGVTAGYSGGCEGEFGLDIVVFDAGFGFIGCFGIETVEKSARLKVVKGGFEGEWHLLEFLGMRKNAKKNVA
jgi:hypothetical protein